MEKENKNTPELVVTLFLLCLITILMSVNFFYIKKDYDFVVETSCNPETESCYFRDCESEDAECPPNNYSYFKMYSINAKDFETCEGEDCAYVCATNLDLCEEIECSEEDGYECLNPEPTV